MKNQAILTILAIAVLAGTGLTGMAANEDYRVSEDGKILTQTVTAGADEEAAAETEIEYEGVKYVLKNSSSEDVFEDITETLSHSETFNFTEAGYNPPETIEHEGVEYTLVNKEYTPEVVRTEKVKYLDIVSETVSIEVPDNNIDRLPLTRVKDGITLDLISVEYTVAASDEYGVPEEYTASCYYAANIERETEVDAEWSITADYMAEVTESVFSHKTITNTYEAALEPETEAVTEPVPEEPEKKSAAPAIAAVAGGGGICCLALGWWLVFKKKKKEK